MLFLTLTSGVVVFVWALLACCLPRAMRRIPVLDRRKQPKGQPRVSIVIPARDEALMLPRLLADVAQQDYPALDVTVVDDHSTDDTAAVAAAFGVKVLSLTGERPAGWAGKCWAAWQGARAVDGEWLLFLDADMILEPSCVRAALAEAQEVGAGALGVLPRADCAGFWEALTQPVFALLVGWQLDPRRINDPKDPTAAAPGGFLLFRREVYDQVGGHQAVRGEIVEDLKLAQLVKGGGHKLWVAATAELMGVRRLLPLRALWNNWTRVVVDGLERRTSLALLGALAVALVFILPEVLAPLGWPTLALAAVHLSLGRWVRAGFRKTYGTDDRLAWLQPIGAAFAVAVLVRAALHTLGRLQVVWRGRSYVPGWPTAASATATDRREARPHSLP
jgi:hypothetical protein